MFDDKEMTAWEDKLTDDKTWSIAKTYFEKLYRSKAKYSEERAARANGFDSANSLADRTRASIKKYFFHWERIPTSQCDNGHTIAR